MARWKLLDEISETRTEAFIDGIWYTISRNRMTYNSEGKRTSLENLAGQITTTTWDCCHKVSEVQPDGSTTTWDYDDEGRVIASSRLIPLDMTNVTWLTTCYLDDARYLESVCGLSGCINKYYEVRPSW